MGTQEPPVDTTASEAEDEVQAPQDIPTSLPVTIGHGPAQIASILTFVAGLLGALAVGITTVVGALPAGVSNAVGATLTAVAATLAALSLGIYAAIRYLNGRLGQSAAVIAQAVKSGN